MEDFETSNELYELWQSINGLIDAVNEIGRKVADTLNCMPVRTGDIIWDKKTMSFTQNN